MTGRIEKTLFLAFYTVSPPSGGASSVTYQLSCHWPGERVLVQIGYEPGECFPRSGLKIVTLRYTGQGERWQKLVAVIRWIDGIAKIAKREQPDTIVLEGASWVAYQWYMMRVLRRCLPGTRLIYHAHNVEYDLRRQKHSQLVAKLTRWCERSLLANVDIATAVSTTDAARFQALYRRNTVLLANCVDVAWLRSASPTAVNVLRTRYSLTNETVLFMGSYGYRPNSEAINLLIRNIFPRIAAQRPQARLLILGGPVPFERTWLIAPGLVPTDDLPAFIQTAALSVAPILSGSGTRLKIIESLAAGVPVISTAKGAEGLDLEAERHLLYAETATDFQCAILRLLNDRALAERLSAEGAAFVATSYDWNSTLQMFIVRLQDILSA